MAIRSVELWNTMVIGAKVETLWCLGLRCFPEVNRLFEVYPDLREEAVSGLQ